MLSKLIQKFIVIIILLLFNKFIFAESGIFPDEPNSPQIEYSITGIWCDSHPVDSISYHTWNRTFNNCYVQSGVSKICASGNLINNSKYISFGYNLHISLGGGSMYIDKSSPSIHSPTTKNLQFDDCLDISLAVYPTQAGGRLWITGGGELVDSLDSYSSGVIFYMQPIKQPRVYIKILPTDLSGTVTCPLNPVPYDSSTTCTASAKNGYIFDKWSGDCSGTNTVCELNNVTSDKNITAEFIPQQQNNFTISTIADPALGGSVICTPNPVQSGNNSTCIATAKNGYVFDNWSGDCTGISSCILTGITSNKSVTAKFKPVANKLTISTTTNPVDGGTVICDPNPVENGKSSKCTATANSGYSFAKWQGDCTGTDQNCIINTITSNKSVTALFNKTSYPALTYGVLSVGVWHNCAITDIGSIVCWGSNDNGKSTPVAGSFIQVSAGGEHTCAIKNDGTLACWGSNSDGQSKPPLGSFIQVSAGYYHTCGVRSDGNVSCWGWNDYGQSAPPSGSFIQVSASFKHTCGLKKDMSIICWGSNDEKQINTPLGTYKQISSNYYNNCGILADNTIECWGSKNDSPTGEYSQVSTGGYHSCAIRLDGVVVCWGANSVNQSSPPAGSFTQIGTGFSHSCGIKTDGSVVCWGSNYSGDESKKFDQATPPTNLKLNGVSIPYKVKTILDCAINVYPTWFPNPKTSNENQVIRQDFSTGWSLKVHLNTVNFWWKTPEMTDYDGTWSLDAINETFCKTYGKGY